MSAFYPRGNAFRVRHKGVAIYVVVAHHANYIFPGSDVFIVHIIYGFIYHNLCFGLGRYGKPSYIYIQLVV